MKIVLITGDYYPNTGGIAELTHNLATALHKQNALMCVITFKSVPPDVEYQVITPPPNLGRNGKKLFGDSIAIVRKLNSFFIYRRYFKWMKLNLSGLGTKNNVLYIVMETWSMEANFAFRHFKDPDLTYGIFFHGAEIQLRHNESIFKKFTNRAKVIIYNSLATKNLMHNYFKITKPELVFYPGIDVLRQDQLPAKRPHALPEINLNTLVISTVCRHISRKGLDIAIRAVQLLESDPNLKNFVYIIAGNGPYTDYLKKISNEIHQKVFFIGYIDDEEKKYILNISDIFIMPNHSNGGLDFEGFGIVFLEAAYFRCACIAGKSGGAVEAVVNGLTGITVDAESHDSVERVSEALRLLLDDEGLRIKMATEGRKRVANEFDIGVLTNNFIKTINAIDWAQNSRSV